METIDLVENETSEIPVLSLARTCPFDPPPEYKQFRAEHPITKVKTPRGDTAWLVTKYDDIRKILTDKRFSSDPRTPGFPTYVTGDIPPPPGFFLQADAPDHTRLRAAVTKEFLNASIELLKPRMQEIFDSALDDMLKMTPPVDLGEALAIPVASQVICELIGVPQKDHAFVKEKTDIVLDRSQPPQETENAAVALMTYFDRIITEKEKAPTDDLFGRLIVDTRDTDTVSHQELVGLAALLLLSAYDTMALAISLGTVILLEHPQQLADLMNDASLADKLVDELVRYLSINHTGLPRAALDDVEIGGQLIRKGDGVLVMINSGNRDEQAFQNPDNFDIHRKERSHVGFGHGLHKCLGVHYAKAELSIAFLTLFRRVPSLRVAVPIDELTFRDEMVLYGLKKLPVTW